MEEEFQQSQGVPEQVHTDETEEREDDDHEEHDVLVEEAVEHAEDKIDALIQLLIKKGVISEEEFDNEFESMFDSDDSDEE